MNPRLTFRRNRFALSDTTIAHRKILNASAYWTCIIDDTYETDSLRAALRFRRFADERAGKVFQRSLQQHYSVPPQMPLPDFLDPHQVDGIRWVLSRKRSYLAHAPGAGKTAQAIVASLLSDGEGIALFIVPPSLTVNWVREIEAFTERLGIWPTIGVVPSSAKKDDMAWRAEFIVCPDSMLTKDWVYTRLSGLKKKLVAVDEASRLKDPFSERSIAFYGGRNKDRVFQGLFQDARHVVLLDGSPLLNRPMELWAPTFALHPEAIDCMSQDDFGYRYCGPQITERGQYTFLHSSHEAELKEKLQNDFMHVVTEEKLDHPERRRSILFMNTDVRTAEQKTWERRHLGSGSTELDEDASQGDLASYRKELGMQKVPFIARYIRERLKEKGESILLFAWHREVCEQLLLELVEHNPGLVYGGTHPTERENIFAQFQGGKRKLIIGNILAMGRGHNLQRADRVVFGEFSWTDELNKQCEKRASRRGSEKEFVRCDYIACPNSIDERVLHSIFTKEKRVKRIIG